MIKAILFDLDGTLLDRHSSLIVYLNQHMIRCGTILNGIPPTEYLSKVIERDAHGHVSKDTVFRQIEKDFNLPEGSWEVLYRDFGNYFPDTCVPFPKMRQTLNHLAECGFLLGLITNGWSTSQDPKIDGLGIRHYFRTVLVSG